MRMRLLRPLDRYVFGEFIRIFIPMAIGFPLLVVIFDLTEKLQKYLERKIPRGDIFLSYVYWLPDSMFMVLPAAVLFATVFSVGQFTRYAELTAAKASGISFFRFIRPVLLGALVAALLDLGLAELVPITNAKRADLLETGAVKSDSLRFNFAYSAEYGRVYKAGMLNRRAGSLSDLQIERKGVGRDYPTYVLATREASWDSARTRWTLGPGELHIIPDTGASFSMSFERMVDRRLHERPADLMAKPRSPQEMRYAELTRFIHALERSGGDANVLRVERALKIAIPVTCLIIALFGAPLATSNQRGGAAYGVGVSLVVTVLFLLLIQLTKAIGSKALIPPDLAAWMPNVIFATLGMLLLARVRS